MTRAKLLSYLAAAVVGVAAVVVLVFGAVLFRQGGTELKRAGPDPTVSYSEGVRIGYAGLAPAYLREVQAWTAAGGPKGQSDKDNGHSLLLAGGWLLAASITSIVLLWTGAMNKHLAPRPAPHGAPGQPKEER